MRNHTQYTISKKLLKTYVMTNGMCPTINIELYLMSFLMSRNLLDFNIHINSPYMSKENVCNLRLYRS